MTIWLSAGEPSGDRWAARLAAAVVRREPGVRLVGMVGPAMRCAGVDGIDAPEGGVMGFAEPLRRARALARTYRAACALLERERPAVSVVIDYPDFHLRLLRRIGALGIPAISYIPPQVWAWRSGRAKVVARRSAYVVPAFAWERAWFAPHLPPGRVVWLGHPLADDLPPADDSPPADDHPPAEGPVALLPGSRRSEIVRLAPILAAAAARAGGDAVFVVHGPEAADWVRAAAGQAVPIVAGCTLDVLAGASAAVVCAGSATLEAACSGIPMIVVYQTDRLTWMLARRLVHVPWCGLPNVILGREAYPELVQDRLTTDSLVAALEAVRREPRERWRALGARVRTSLGESGVADRVAGLVLHVAGRTPGDEREGAR